MTINTSENKDVNKVLPGIISMTFADKADRWDPNKANHLDDFDEEMMYESSPVYSRDRGRPCPIESDSGASAKASFGENVNEDFIAKKDAVSKEMATVMVKFDEDTMEMGYIISRCELFLIRLIVNGC